MLTLHRTFFQLVMFSYQLEVSRWIVLSAGLIQPNIGSAYIRLVIVKKEEVKITAPSKAPAALSLQAIEGRPPQPFPGSSDPRSPFSKDCFCHLLIVVHSLTAL